MQMRAQRVLQVQARVFVCMCDVTEVACTSIWILQVLLHVLVVAKLLLDESGCAIRAKSPVIKDPGQQDDVN